MAATLIETKSIAIEGLKSVFKVPKQDVVEVDGKHFICFKPYTPGLIALVTEQNVLAPSPLPKNFSLTTSSGLRMIKECRNEAQRDDLEAGPGGSNLFEVAAKKPKKSHVPQHEIKKAREDLVPITCTLPWGAEDIQLTVLRPVQARDSLWIEYKATTMAFVIKILREAGFNEEPSQKAMELPKGVMRKRDGYLVRWKVLIPEMKMKNKTFEDVDEAIRFQAMDDDAKEEYIAAQREADEAAGHSGEDHRAASASGEEEKEDEVDAEDDAKDSNKNSDQNGVDVADDDKTGTDSH